MTDWQVLLGIAAVVIVVVLFAQEHKKKPRTTKQTQDANKEMNKVPEMPIRNVLKTENVVIVKNGIKQEGRVEYMSYGLRVWDKSGNLILDTSDRLIKVLGQVKIGYDDQKSGQVYDSKLSAGEMWWVIKKEENMYAGFNSLPRVWKDGNVLRWEAVKDGSAMGIYMKMVKGTLIYGVY